MLYAHTATEMLNKNGDLKDGRAVTEAMRTTLFEGVSGSMVSLDKNGDKIESYEVMNYVVGKGGQMGSVPVGAYNSTSQQYTPYEQAVVWPGNTTEVPVDYLLEAPGGEGCIRGRKGLAFFVCCIFIKHVRRACFNLTI